MQMKLFGLFGKGKPMPFPQFRDMVRLAARRSLPGVKIENSETGLILMTPDNKAIACNLRQLYNNYCKTPGDRDLLISQWVDTLVNEPPEQTWAEARPTLRPILKDAEFLAAAHASMLRQQEPDSLPYAPFVGELSVIVMREFKNTLTAVTQRQLDTWGETFDRATQEALNNMNLMSFPPVTNSLLAGGNTRKGETAGEVVGLVFEGDHLTATWIIVDRFRDHLAQRLQGDYVAFTPNRSRLIAVRADEPGLIASMQHAHRNYRSLPYSLSAQAIHVSTAQTGGVVTIFQQGGKGAEAFDRSSIFAGGSLGAAPDSAAHAVATPSGAAYRPPQPVDLSAWGGLSESTLEPAPPGSPSGKLGR
jgi:hypothetical protein